MLQHLVCRAGTTREWSVTDLFPSEMASSKRLICDMKIIAVFGRLSCMGIVAPGRESCALWTIVVISMRLSPVCKVVNNGRFKNNCIAFVRYNLVRLQ